MDDNARAWLSNIAKAKPKDEIDINITTPLEATDIYAAQMLEWVLTQAPNISFGQLSSLLITALFWVNFLMQVAAGRSNNPPDDPPPPEDPKRTTPRGHLPPGIRPPTPN